MSWQSGAAGVNDRCSIILTSAFRGALYERAGLCERSECGAACRLCMLDYIVSISSTRARASTDYIQTMRLHDAGAHIQHKHTTLKSNCTTSMGLDWSLPTECGERMHKHLRFGIDTTIC
jgi:hypothetical protein